MVPWFRWLDVLMACFFFAEFLSRFYIADYTHGSRRRYYLSPLGLVDTVAESGRLARPSGAAS